MLTSPDLQCLCTPMMNDVKLYSQRYAEQLEQNKTVTGKPVCNEAM